MRNRGSLVKPSGPGRKLSSCSEIHVTFSEWPWVAILTTCIVWGAGCQTKVAPLLRRVSFHLPAGMHPTTFLHCHLPLLGIFYPISKSLSVWHPLKYTGEGGSNALTIFPHPSLEGSSLLCNLNMKACPPLGGGGCGQGYSGFKKTFGPPLPPTSRNP